MQGTKNIKCYYLTTHLKHNGMSNLKVEGYFFCFRQQASRILGS
jgi:hypothetical protein